MKANYPIVVIVVIAAIILITFLVRRNRKDEKKFEKDLNQSEMKPEKHDDEATRL